MQSQHQQQQQSAANNNLNFEAIPCVLKNGQGAPVYGLLVRPIQQAAVFIQQPQQHQQQGPCVTTSVSGCGASNATPNGLVAAAGGNYPSILPLPQHMAPVSGTKILLPSPPSATTVTSGHSRMHAVSATASDQNILPVPGTQKQFFIPASGQNYNGQTQQISFDNSASCNNQMSNITSSFALSSAGMICPTSVSDTQISQQQNDRLFTDSGAQQHSNNNLYQLDLSQPGAYQTFPLSDYQQQNEKVRNWCLVTNGSPPGNSGQSSSNSTPGSATSSSANSSGITEIPHIDQLLQEISNCDISFNLPSEDVSGESSTCGASNGFNQFMEHFDGQPFNLRPGTSSAVMHNNNNNLMSAETSMRHNNGVNKVQQQFGSVYEQCLGPGPEQAFAQKRPNPQQQQQECFNAGLCDTSGQNYWTNNCTQITVEQQNPNEANNSNMFNNGRKAPKNPPMPFLGAVQDVNHVEWVNDGSTGSPDSGIQSFSGSPPPRRLSPFPLNVSSPLISQMPADVYSNGSQTQSSSQSGLSMFAPYRPNQDLASASTNFYSSGRPADCFMDKQLMVEVVNYEAISDCELTPKPSCSTGVPVCNFLPSIDNSSESRHQTSTTAYQSKQPPPSAKRAAKAPRASRGGKASVRSKVGDCFNDMPILVAECAGSRTAAKKADNSRRTKAATLQSSLTGSSPYLPASIGSNVETSESMATLNVVDEMFLQGKVETLSKRFEVAKNIVLGLSLQPKGSDLKDLKQYENLKEDHPIQVIITPVTDLPPPVVLMDPPAEPPHSTDERKDEPPPDDPQATNLLTLNFADPNAVVEKILSTFKPQELQSISKLFQQKLLSAGTTGTDREPTTQEGLAPISESRQTDQTADPVQLEGVDGTSQRAKLSLSIVCDSPRPVPTSKPSADSWTTFAGYLSDSSSVSSQSSFLAKQGPPTASGHNWPVKSLKSSRRKYSDIIGSNGGTQKTLKPYGNLSIQHLSIRERKMHEKLLEYRKMVKPMISQENQLEKLSEQFQDLCSSVKSTVLEKPESLMPPKAFRCSALLKSSETLTKALAGGVNSETPKASNVDLKSDDLQPFIEAPETTSSSTDQGRTDVNNFLNLEEEASESSDEDALESLIQKTALMSTTTSTPLPISVKIPGEEVDQSSKLESPSPLTSPDSSKSSANHMVVIREDPQAGSISMKIKLSRVRTRVSSMKDVDKSKKFPPLLAIVDDRNNSLQNNSAPAVQAEQSVEQIEATSNLRNIFDVLSVSGESTASESTIAKKRKSDARPIAGHSKIDMGKPLKVVVSPRSPSVADLHRKDSKQSNTEPKVSPLSLKMIRKRVKVCKTGGNFDRSKSSNRNCFKRCKDCRVWFRNYPIDSGNVLLCSKCSPKRTGTERSKVKHPLKKRNFVNYKTFLRKAASSQKMSLVSSKTYVRCGIAGKQEKPESVGSGVWTSALASSRQQFRKTRHFELPYDVWAEFLLVSTNIHAVSTSRNNDQTSSSYRKILTNLYVDTKVASASTACSEPSPIICNCKLPPTTSASASDDLSSPSGCKDDCLNRIMYTECCPAQCPCADRCSNQRFQNRKWCQTLEKIDTGSQRGFGVRTNAPIGAEEFICEYVGEVVSAQTFRWRMRNLYSKASHHYALNLDAGTVIDAYSCGNIARFINHSCKPNCEVQKWLVNGQYRMGVFALRNIEAGEELAYDYNFRSFDIQQKCLCGNQVCRGSLGGRLGSTKKAKTVLKPTKSKMDCEKIDDIPLSRILKPLSQREKLFARRESLFLLRNITRRTRRSSQPSRPGRNKRLFKAFTGQTTFRSRKTSVGEEVVGGDGRTSCPEHNLQENVSNQFPELKIAILKIEQLREEDLHSVILSPGAIATNENFVDTQYNADDDADVWLLRADQYEGDNDDKVRCTCGISEDDGLMVQCDRCLYWQHTSCIGERATIEDNDQYFCDRCLWPETYIQTKGSILLQPQPEIRLPGCTYYRTLVNGSFQIRIGECVYVRRILDDGQKQLLRALNSDLANQRDAKEMLFSISSQDFPNESTTSGSASCNPLPDYSARFIDHADLRIFRAERLFEGPRGDKFVFGSYFARPHETFSEPTRRFYRNEVFCTPLYDTLPLESVVSRCLVLDPSAFCKGRPRLPKYRPSDVYICEFRVDRSQRLFGKLKYKYPLNQKSHIFQKFDEPLKVKRDFTPFNMPKQTGQKRKTDVDTSPKKKAKALSKTAANEPSKISSNQAALKRDRLSSAVEVLTKSEKHFSSPAKR